MTAKPIALEKARRAKAAALARLEELEQMQHSMQFILGCLLERAKCHAVTFDVDELEAFDPRRLVIIHMAEHGKVIIGLKADGDAPFELDLTKGALQAVSDPAPETAP